MAAAIRKRYPKNTKVNVDSPCIVVNFWDYKFEIVPAYSYSDNPDLYSIPAPGSKEWMDCYPNVPDKWLSSCNHSNNSLFIPLIKMVKQWNRHNKVGLKSFHLELLTEKVFGNVTSIYSYPQAIFDWMYCVHDWIQYNDSPFILEPGKSYTHVDNYLYGNQFRLRVVRKKLEAGLKCGERAWNLYQKGRYSAAKRLWNRIFGSKFPVPQVSVTTQAPVQPNPSSASTLQGLLYNRPAMGFLNGSNQNTLLDALSNPRPKSQPKMNTLLGAILRAEDPFKR